MDGFKQHFKAHADFPPIFDIRQHLNLGRAPVDIGRTRRALILALQPSQIALRFCRSLNSSQLFRPYVVHEEGNPVSFYGLAAALATAACPRR